MQESLTKFMLVDESSSDKFPSKNCMSLPFNNKNEIRQNYIVKFLSLERVEIFQKSTVSDKYLIPACWQLSLIVNYAT